MLANHCRLFQARYEDVKDRLLTNNYDYFDLIHTVLPTTLPLKEFYNEYFLLMWKAVTFGKRIAFLRKHAWNEIPGVLLNAYKILGRLKKAYLDYN